MVTALSEGTSVITAIAQDGGFSDTISILVNAPAAGDDIALNKLVYSTGSADGSNVDANLVDGDLSSRWSVSGFPQEGIIDLGANFSIGSTELVCYSDRAYQYEISVSDIQNGNYATIVDRSSNSTLGTEASPIKDVFSSVSTRFVKIRVIGAASYEGTWVSLLDFKIFSESDQEPPVEVAAPYDIPKFQSYLELCKLQSPLSNTEATASSIMNGYSSASFFVADSDKIAFSQTRDANATKVRSELRYENNWLVENQNRSLHANLDVKIQTCEQLTLLQIHDDANAGNGPNKPLLRVYSLNGGLFAAVKTDSEGVATTHIPMGSLPSGYFDCDISLEDERLLVSVNGSEFVNRDISYWSFPSYWKNGAYLQDTGEALVYFNELSETVSSVIIEPEKSNVALNKSAVASEQQSENPASNLLDGDADSRWSAQYFPQSVVVDLGGVYTISATEVVCFNDRAYQFIIEASTDNNNYSLIVDRSNNTSSGSNDNPISDAFSNTEARYVRVSVSGANSYSGSWVSLEELRVLGYSTLSSKEADQKLALKVEEAEDEVSIWPNPAKNSIHISGYENLHSIRIYNQLGSLVIDKGVSSETIDISQLATGTYTVILRSDTETISKRIVKL